MLGWQLGNAIFAETVHVIRHHNCQDLLATGPGVNMEHTEVRFSAIWANVSVANV
jgi:hypothetical protein